MRFAESRAGLVPERWLIDSCLEHRGTLGYHAFRKAAMRETINAEFATPECHIQQGIPALNAKMFHAAARHSQLEMF
jgi:hypothetical protein